jgi:hypothetical protein
MFWTLNDKRLQLSQRSAWRTKWVLCDNPWSNVRYLPQQPLKDEHDVLLSNLRVVVSATNTSQTIKCVKKVPFEAIFPAQVHGGTVHKTRSRA